MRGKFGITLTDRVLVHVTGGLAIADVDHGGALTAAAVVTRDFSNTHLGFTAGAGAEMAVTDWISAFVEYRYTQYGDESFAASGPFLAHDFDVETH